MTKFEEVFKHPDDLPIHEDKYVQAFAAAVFFYPSDFSDDQIRFMVPDHYASATNRFSQYSKWISDWQQGYQQDVIGWVTSGVHATIEGLGGMAVFRTVLPDSQVWLWKSLWDLSPQLMAENMWKLLSEYVAFNAIFSGNGPERKDWRLFCRYLFAKSAELVYCQLVEPFPDPGRMIKSKAWRSTYGVETQMWAGKGIYLRR
ncbi:hypothetical protein MMC20_007525 [Loxospora ochrophaea]|nr:hypothetical protein [Loxospora ochrophaea]